MVKSCRQVGNCNGDDWGGVKRCAVGGEGGVRAVLYFFLWDPKIDPPTRKKILYMALIMGNAGQHKFCKTLLHWNGSFLLQDLGRSSWHLLIPMCSHLTNKKKKIQNGNSVENIHRNKPSMSCDWLSLLFLVHLHVILCSRPSHLALRKFLGSRR